MGVDAAGFGPGSGGAGVESAGLGTVDGEDPARKTFAGGKPAAQDRRPRSAGGGRLSVQSGGCAGCGCRGDWEERAAGGAELAAAAAVDFDGDFWGAE